MGALRSIFTSELFSFNFCSELEILGELRRADSLMFRVPPETEGRPGWRRAAPAGGGRAVPREVAGLGPVSLQPSRWPLRGSLLPVSSGPTREGTMAWQARGSTTAGLRPGTPDSCSHWRRSITFHLCFPPADCTTRQLVMTWLTQR